MKNILGSSLLLGFVLMFLGAATLFNINQSSSILDKQDALNTNIENLKNKSTSMAYDLGQLARVDVPPSVKQANNDYSEQMDDAPVSGSDQSAMDSSDPNTPTGTSSVTSDDIKAIFKNAPTTELKSDQNPSEMGKAAMAVYNGKTMLKIAAINLPKLQEGQHYSAWLADKASSGQAYFLGDMNYEASSSNATLLYAGNGDLSNYRKVMISVETQNTGAPSGQPVMQGEFDDNANFNVTVDNPSSMMNSQDKADGVQGMVGSLMGSGGALGATSLEEAIKGSSLQDLLKALKK